MTRWKQMLEKGLQMRNPLDPSDVAMTTDPQDLPPLPEIDWLSQFVPVYAREHMRAYAKAARDQLLAKIAEQEKEIERMKGHRVSLKERAEAAERELTALRLTWEDAKKLHAQEMEEMRAKLEAIYNAPGFDPDGFPCQDGMWIERPQRPNAARAEKP